MFSYEPLLIMLALLLLIWFWQDALRAKELATLAARRACQQSAVEFLDDSVVFQRFVWRRNVQGRKFLQRDYGFEFSVDGSCRFQGRVTLRGRRVVDLYMEPYPLQEAE